MRGDELVTAYFNRGKDFVVTALLEVDGDTGFLLIDGGSNPQMNERLLQSAELLLVSNQEGVKIQFHAPQPKAASFEGRLAFRIPFPSSLLKLQRREYFRLPAPVSASLNCVIPLPGGDRVELAIGDISLGGINISGEASGIRLEPGMTFQACRISLPDVGTLVTGLCVQNSAVITLKTGVTARRTGCKFVDLGATNEAMIQRYIIKLERDRRAKLDQLAE